MMDVLAFPNPWVYSTLKIQECKVEPSVLHTEINFKKLSETAQQPKVATNHAAAADLYSDEEVEVNPGCTVKVTTNIALEIPSGFCGLIFARSGLATKEGLRPANCVGVVDSDYRGPVIVAIHNDSSEKRLIPKGERIAQLMITPYLRPEFTEVNELSNTDRGEGGFGSTGKN